MILIEGYTSHTRKETVRPCAGDTAAPRDACCRIII